MRCALVHDYRPLVEAGVLYCARCGDVVQLAPVRDRDTGVQSRSVASVATPELEDPRRQPDAAELEADAYVAQRTADLIARARENARDGGVDFELEPENYGDLEQPPERRQVPVDDPNDDSLGTHTGL